VFAAVVLTAVGLAQTIGSRCLVVETVVIILRTAGIKYLRME